jgi:hypothetical protein
VVRHASPAALVASPVSACAVGVLAGVVLSDLTRFSFWGVQTSGVEFFQILLYYFLILATVGSAGRLRAFLAGRVAFIAAIAAVAILQFHEVIDIPSLAVNLDRRVDPETGELSVWRRLVGTGIFNDPNDLSQILVVGMVTSLGLAGDRRMGALRVGWAGMIVFLGYALTLTQSRGGLLALLAALAVLFQARYGWWKALPLLLLTLPGVLLMAGDRQAGISDAMASDTGHGRVELWAEGLYLFRGSPVFGIGAGQYVEQVMFVAHNSFVHCYTELGVFGGTFFTGAFVCAVWSLVRLGKAPPPGADAEVLRMRPYVLAALVGNMTSLLSLSRPYGLTTYLLLGLVAAYVRVAAAESPDPVLRFDGPLLRRLALISVVVVIVLHVVVRLLL